MIADRGPSAVALLWFRAFGVLLALLAPALLLALAHRLWLRRRALVGLRAKLCGDGPALPRGAVMVHAVSLGEVALLRPLLPVIRRHFGVRLVLTTTTETGMQGLERHFPDVPRTFLPFDLPWAVATFLRRTRPRALVLTEAELWPLLLFACRARAIPVIVLNARLSARSHRRFSMLRPLVRRLIGCLDLAIAQTADYAAKFRDLGLPAGRLAIAGSLKADMVMLPAPAAVTAWAAQVRLDQRPLLLLASTSEGEEELVLRAVLTTVANKDWQVVVCPRHPERGAAIAAAIRAMGMTAVRSGDGGTLAPRIVLVVDEIGRLGLLYAWTAQTAGIAIVGGSLGSGRGGQNMLEAAAAGCCTVVGWDTKAQPDPMALLRRAGAVVELKKDAIAWAIGGLLDDAEQRRRLGLAAAAAWAAGRGALARTERILGTFIR